MIDWTRQMRQDFEYWLVDPITWSDVEKLDCVTGASLTFDTSAETIGTASFTTYETLKECYIRTYMKCTQLGAVSKIALGTNLVQTPSKSYDGYTISSSLDAYSPLLELKDSSPELGYTVRKDVNIMSIFSSIYKSHCRAPLTEGYESDKKTWYDYTAESDDTWLSFLTSLVNLDDKYISVDGYGRVYLTKNQRLKQMTPTWVFDSRNSSILYPETTDKADYYGIPNVVEVIYSEDDLYFYSRVENHDDSDLSLEGRGREVLYRETSPDFNGTPNQNIIDEYAKSLMETKSTLSHEVSLKHGYCSAKINDAVIINQPDVGLDNVKGYITAQSISCEPGCPITSTITYTDELWSGNVN